MEEQRRKGIIDDLVQMQKEIYTEQDPNKKMKMYKDWLASRANPPPENTNTMTLEDFKIGFDNSA